MNELKEWLDFNKIRYQVVDNEVVEIVGFGKMFLAELSDAKSIFRGTKDNLTFNLMENPKTLIDEGIYYVAFQFGKNWYYFDLRADFKFNILKYVGERQPAECTTKFVNLGIHTPYELLNGSGDLSLWVKKAKLLGHHAIGICDLNTMAATLSFQKECAKEGLKHVFGYSFILTYRDEEVEMKIYCQTQKGLKNLLRLHKLIMVDSKENRLLITQLLLHAQGNVLVLGKLSSQWMKRNPVILVEMKKLFEKIFYQVDLSEYKAERFDIAVLNAAKYFFENFYNPNTERFSIEPILICDNYYLDKDDAGNKIILNKIASGAAHMQSEDQYFKDADEHLDMMYTIFDSEYWDIEELFERMCDNTLYIAKNAHASFEIGKMYMPEYIMLEEEIKKYRTGHRMFLALLENGLQTRIPEHLHAIYKERLKEEVYIIESTNNVDYFLIQWDMVKEAKKRGITTGIGRGSAGGSLVSYLLGIISIDPIKYDLLFSRFLVPERCGLSRVDEITIVGEKLKAQAGEKVVEVKIGGKKVILFIDAQLRIKRGGELMTVYADELRMGDEILFDNRDLLWTLNERNI